MAHTLHVHFHNDDYLIKVNHRGTKLFKCKYCRKLVKNKQRALVHEASHVEYESADEKEALGILRCLQCDKRFNDRAKWDRHKQYAHIDDTLICEECGKTFRTAAEFQAHEDLYK